MTETFYRLHRTDAPAFSADNAWSAPWGETFNATGDAYECRACDGTGEQYDEPCTDCDEGWINCDPGYSACHTATDLLAYFDQHCPADDADPVVEFAGQQVGCGLDGEPLVIPTEIIHWTTIGALRARKDMR